LGALLRCESIARDGILLLRHGQARVLLGRAAGRGYDGGPVLYSLDRYDAERQRPLFDSDKKQRKEKTVVIDESSMLTMDDLQAVLRALDWCTCKGLSWSAIQPVATIGSGALCRSCRQSGAAAQSADPEQRTLGGAMGKLTVEVRSSRTNHPIRCVWPPVYREQQPADADKVFYDLELGTRFNDLEIRFWKTPRSCAPFSSSLLRPPRAENPDDVAGFDKALGLTEQSGTLREARWGRELSDPLPCAHAPVRHLCAEPPDSGAIPRRRTPPGAHSHQDQVGDEEIVVRDK